MNPSASPEPYTIRWHPIAFIDTLLRLIGILIIVALIGGVLANATGVDNAVLFVISFTLIISFLIWSAFDLVQSRTKHNAYVHNGRVVVVKHEGRGDSVWSFDASAIEQASVHYPSRLAKRIGVGNVNFSGAGEMMHLHGIAQPQDLVDHIAGLHQPELTSSVVSKINEPATTPEVSNMIDPAPPLATPVTSAPIMTEVPEAQGQLITAEDIPARIRPSVPSWKVPHAASAAIADELQENIPVYF